MEENPDAVVCAQAERSGRVRIRPAGRVYTPHKPRGMLEIRDCQKFKKKGSPHTTPAPVVRWHTRKLVANLFLKTVRWAAIGGEYHVA